MPLCSFVVALLLFVRRHKLKLDVGSTNNLLQVFISELNNAVAGVARLGRLVFLSHESYFFFINMLSKINTQFFPSVNNLLGLNSVNKLKPLFCMG